MLSDLHNKHKGDPKEINKYYYDGSLAAVRNHPTRNHRSRNSAFLSSPSSAKAAKAGPRPRRSLMDGDLEAELQAAPAVA